MATKEWRLKTRPLRAIKYDNEFICCIKHPQKRACRPEYINNCIRKCRRCRNYNKYGKLRPNLIKYRNQPDVKEHELWRSRQRRLTRRIQEQAW